MRPLLPRISHPLLLVLLSTSVTVAFLGFMLAATEGHAVPQVVDLYLICQYARAWAEGHPFRYHPADAPSTGSTSLAHTLVLAAAHAIGLRGELLIAFAIALGALCYAVSTLMAWRIGLALGGAREALLAGLLVALGGPMVWGFLYGSDIAPFMLLSLWLLHSLLGDWARGGPRWSPVAAALLVLTRPEGLALSLALASFWTLSARRGSGWRRLAPWAPVALGLGVLGLNQALTGQWLATSVADKSLLSSYSPADAMALWAEYVIDVVRGIGLGLYPSQIAIGFSRGWATLFLPPLGLVFALVALATAPDAVRPALYAWAAAVAGVALLVAPSTFMGVHFNRYLMWVLPTVSALAAVGLGALTRLLARESPEIESRLFRTGAALAVGLAGLATLRSAALYGEMAGEVYRRDVAAARWISRNLPAGVPIANLATSVEYLTGHQSVNLHGVTTPAFFGNRPAERDAGVFESLGRLPPAERPAYLLTTLSTQERQPVMREMVDGPPVYQSQSLGDDIQIFRTRFDLAGRNAALFLPETRAAVQGLREVDRLNVCDPQDEDRHAYRFRSKVGNLRLHGTVRLASYRLPEGEMRLADGGRAILGGESFEVRATPARDLVIVLRTAPEAEAGVFRPSGASRYALDLGTAVLNVDVGGSRALTRRFAPREGWDEQVLVLPASLVQSPCRLSLTGQYASFHYWFFQ